MVDGARVYHNDPAVGTRHEVEVLPWAVEGLPYSTTCVRQLGRGEAVGDG